MANLIELTLLVAGLALLVVGYRRNERRLLAASALVLFLAGAGVDIASGLRDGFNAGMTHAAR